MNEEIEKIDTTKPIRMSSRDLHHEILVLQQKVNELIDVVNYMMMPDEDTYDDDEEAVVIKPGDINIQSEKKPKKH